MTTLAWFVESALDSAGIPHSDWGQLPQSQQIQLIENWQMQVSVQQDYVKIANFQPEKKKMESRPDKPKDLPYEDFAKLDIRTGLVLTADPVPKSKKLVKLQVSFGDLGERTILAGVGEHIPLDALVNTIIVAVLNLAPRSMMGVMSYGMLLAVHTTEGRLALVRAPGASEGREVG